jgi:CRP-like cAMP-binding protein
MPERLLDKAVLKTLVPPQSLNHENFQELAQKAVVENIAAGRDVFKKGDMDRKTVYLLEGDLELRNDTGIAGVLRGGSKESKHPIANQQPRQVTARAKSKVTIVRFDTDLLDILLTWDQLSGIEVSEVSMDHGPSGQSSIDAGSSGDWMTRILQSKAFLRIPPANIQHMFMRLHEMPVKAGQVIIKQGDDGDYYYIICQGKCKVARASASGSKVTLAQLGDGDAFGEEALLSDGKRNATVVMESDGLLMRLSKEDFNHLLKEPMLKEVDLEQAKAMVKQGAVLIDVRMESEHKAGSIKGSVNIPLFMLRLKSEGFDSNKKYICYCETGRRSQAAAYIMSEAGFDSSVLKGGLQAISQGQAQSQGG